MSRLMGKPTICTGENKGADQLRSNCEADQRLIFRYTDSTCTCSSTFLIQNVQPLSIFCDCTARFASDLVGTQIVGFLTHRLISCGVPRCLQRIMIKAPAVMEADMKRANELLNHDATAVHPI